jgi:hypothetical protein
MRGATYLLGRLRRALRAYVTGRISGETLDRIQTRINAQLDKLENEQ